ncbi:uri1, prefoldin-like chaperone [Balamuthia mandrillaris]
MKATKQEALSKGVAGNLLYGDPAVQERTSQALHTATLRIQKALEENKRETDELQRLHGNYRVLDGTLASIRDKTTQPMMVPLGPLAFMPGRIVHTNEVLVLLGDNYFAERSVEQSRGIVARRLREVEKQIDELTVQMGELRARLLFTEEMKERNEELGKYVEIREEYNSDDEQEEVERPVIAANPEEDQACMDRLLQLMKEEEEEDDAEEEETKENEKGKEKVKEAEEKKTTTSILKGGEKKDSSNKNKTKKAVSFATDTKAEQAATASTVTTTTTTASPFLGAVVERPVAPVVPPPSSSSSSPASTTGGQKRVSRFKASRGK